MKFLVALSLLAFATALPQPEDIAEAVLLQAVEVPVEKVIIVDAPFEQQENVVPAISETLLNDVVRVVDNALPVETLDAVKVVDAPLESETTVQANNKEITKVQVVNTPVVEELDAKAIEQVQVVNSIQESVVANEPATIVAQSEQVRVVNALEVSDEVSSPVEKVQVVDAPLQAAAAPSEIVEKVQVVEELEFNQIMRNLKYPNPLLR